MRASDNSWADQFSAELVDYIDTLAALGIEFGRLPSATRPVADGNVSVGLVSAYDDGRFTVYAFRDITAGQWWQLLRTVESIWWSTPADVTVLDHVHGWVRSDTRRRYDTEVVADPT